MMMYTLQNIESFISEIPDPEIPVITIKDLGILRKVEFADNNYIITITPTYTACPAMGLIENQIKENLSSHGINNVKVVLTYAPAWSTDWINEKAKIKLTEYGIAAPRHSECGKLLGSPGSIECPRCKSKKTEMISYFGSTACKALYKCNDCKEPFEYFKCH